MKRTRKRRNFELYEFIFLEVLVVCIALAIPVASAVNKLTNERTVTSTVTDKGVLKFRFDSSDLYNDVQIGETYEFTICGSRVPWLSWYPNIYKIKKAE